VVVIVLTACTAGLRGDLSRWLEEIAPGIFVGHLSKRIRVNVWARVREGVGDGRALLVWSERGPQRLSYDSVGHDWVPTDFDGLTLMMRPGDAVPASNSRNLGWSTASRLRRFGRESERRR